MMQDELLQRHFRHTSFGVVSLFCNRRTQTAFTFQLLVNMKVQSSAPAVGDSSTYAIDMLSALKYSRNWN